jgi:hypothetical protein
MIQLMHLVAAGVPLRPLQGSWLMLSVYSSRGCSRSLGLPPPFVIVLPKGVLLPVFGIGRMSGFFSDEYHWKHMGHMR